MCNGRQNSSRTLPQISLTNVNTLMDSTVAIEIQICPMWPILADDVSYKSMFVAIQSSDCPDIQAYEHPEICTVLRWYLSHSTKDWHRPCCTLISVLCQYHSSGVVKPDNSRVSFSLWRYSSDLPGRLNNHMATKRYVLCDDLVQNLQMQGRRLWFSKKARGCLLRPKQSKGLLPWQTYTPGLTCPSRSR